MKIGEMGSESYRFSFDLLQNITAGATSGCRSTKLGCPDNSILVDFTVGRSFMMTGVKSDEHLVVDAFISEMEIGGYELWKILLGVFGAVLLLTLFCINRCRKRALKRRELEREFGRNGTYARGPALQMARQSVMIPKGPSIMMPTAAGAQATTTAKLAGPAMRLPQRISMMAHAQKRQRYDPQTGQRLSMLVPAQPPRQSVVLLQQNPMVQGQSPSVALVPQHMVATAHTQRKSIVLAPQKPALQAPRRSLVFVPKDTNAALKNDSKPKDGDGKKAKEAETSKDGGDKGGKSKDSEPQNKI